MHDPFGVSDLSLSLREESQHTKSQSTGSNSDFSFVISKYT
jgi:hypothetical protein